MEVSEECVICGQPIGTSPKATLGEKGSANINKASRGRKKTVHCMSGQQVYQECRRKYCKPAKTLRLKGQ